MLRFVARRLAFLIITLFGVSILAFIIPYLQKGDPTRTILRSRVGDFALDPSAVAAMSHHLGLDQPLYVQYLRWLGDALSGNLGISFTSQEPVLPVILRALSVSIILALVVLGAALVIAVPLGVAAALRPGGALDNVITGITQGFVPMPEYWLGPMAILVFAVWLRWLPSEGWFGPEYVVLPASVLALRPLAYLTSVTRASMINVLRSPYITASRARGSSRFHTVTHHGLRNATPPVMTLFTLWLANLLGGSVIVEVIFGVPGMGRLLYGAVINADLPLIQAGLLFAVGLAVIINSATDIGYVFLNPAVALGERTG